MLYILRVTLIFIPTLLGQGYLKIQLLFRSKRKKKLEKIREISGDTHFPGNNWC